MCHITIILTSFNHEEFIADAITSVLEQSFTDFELIIIDDCSEDNSWEIIQGFNDLRIVKIRNAVRSRGVYGINEAIRHYAKGEYIAIHHSDDIWLPEKLEKQVAFLEQNQNTGAVFTRVMLIDGSGSDFQNPTHFYYDTFEQTNRSRFEWLNYFFYHGNCLCHPSVMVRKSCYEDIGLYDRRFAQLGDFEMWIRLCLKYEIHIIPEPLVKFRVLDNEANASGNRLENRVRIEIELQQILGHYMSSGCLDEVNKIFPKLTGFAGEENAIPKYLVAKLAIRSGSTTHKVFGINQLYELLSEPGDAQLVKQTYGFYYQDLIRIAGDSDMFHLLERISLEQINIDLLKEVTRVKSTFSWQITKPLRLLPVLSRLVKDKLKW